MSTTYAGDLLDVYRQSIKASEQGDTDSLKKISQKFHGQAIGDFAKWLYLTHNSNPATFEDMYKSIDKYSAWPNFEKIVINTENKLSFNIEKFTLIDWCKKFPAKTGNAHRICALANIKNNKNNVPLFAVKAWLNGSFSSDEQKDFLYNYSRYLSEDYHMHRINNMLWNGSITQAKRTIPNLKNIKNINLANKLIRLADNNKVSLNTEDLDNSYILYMLCKSEVNQNKDISHYIKKLSAIKHIGNVDKWWSLINLSARESISKHDYKTAYNILKQHRLRTGANYADAEWLMGWISLRYIKNPAQAEKHFMNMYKDVSFTMSKARAEYWLARVYQTMKKNDLSVNWYKKAAYHYHNFYGQTALLHLGNNKISITPRNPHHNAKLSKMGTEYNKMLQISKNLLLIDADTTASIFLKKIAASAKHNDDVNAIIKQCNDSQKKKHIKVAVAKIFTQNGILLPNHSYPRRDFAQLKTVHPAFTHAIIRQESMFYPKAKSSAGATGMMQLLPDTARQMANCYQYKYVQQKLYDSDYNIMIGQTYLHHLLELYNNNFILTIASYNAGIGNVRKWIEKNGDPREFYKLEDIIDWIEHVPFAETRNYIQRVIENYNVYGKMMDKDHVIDWDKIMGSK